jgi:hypothetical protein
MNRKIRSRSMGLVIAGLSHPFAVDMLELNLTFSQRSCDDVVMIIHGLTVDGHVHQTQAIPGSGKKHAVPGTGKSIDCSGPLRQYVTGWRHYCVLFTLIQDGFAAIAPP